MSVVQRVLDDLLRQVVSGRRTGLHEDRNVSVVAVMGELGVIAEADSVFLSSDSRRCPIPGEVELIALYGDADALQIIQIRKAQAVRLGRDEHFDIALDGIVVRVGEQAVQRVLFGSDEEVDAFTAAGVGHALVVDEDIVSGPAVERVVARPAVEVIVTRAALQDVVARAAEDLIVPFAAEQPIVARAAVDDVVAAFAEDHL